MIWKWSDTARASACRYKGPMGVVRLSAITSDRVPFGTRSFSDQYGLRSFLDSTTTTQRPFTSHRCHTLRVWRASTNWVVLSFLASFININMIEAVMIWKWSDTARAGECRYKGPMGIGRLSAITSDRVPFGTRSDVIALNRPIPIGPL